MSMLSSYTLLSRAPLPPGKFSRAAAQPAATVSLPRNRIPVVVSSTWRQLFVCRCAQKNTYNIHPNALVNRSPTVTGSDWNIMEDNDHVILKFKVGEGTGKDKLDVATTDDQVLLIKYTGDGADNSPASKLDVRLLMPQGYTGDKVTASIVAGGWLQITIGKPKHDTKPVSITGG